MVPSSAAGMRHLLYSPIGVHDQAARIFELPAVVQLCLFLKLFADERSKTIVRKSIGHYFSFVKTLCPPFRFMVIWFFAASNSKTMPAAVPLSILNLSCAVASSGTADCAPGGCA